MSRTVFLHVGLPKSGTSYLQRLLSANKPALAERAGLLFPGRAWNQQVLAVRDLRDMSHGRVVEGAWARLVDEVVDWQGDSVISMEWLCAATEEQIGRVLTDLAPARVEVVFTARDLGRTLPAAWQEFMQNQQTWPWEEFLGGVTADPPTAHPAGRAFWSQQDLPALLARWSRGVDAEQLHVVTLPHPGAARDVLWRRFAEVLGIDPAGYLTEGLGGNESLGLESTELMRRLNQATKDAGIDRLAYTRVIKHHLAKRVLSQRKAEESVLTVPAAYHAWVQGAAARQIEAIGRLGLHVVGDLRDLEPVLSATEGRQPSEVTDSELLTASLTGLIGLSQRRDQKGKPSS